MAAACIEHGLEVWAWCLMPDHVHRVVVPETADALARAIGETHRRYTRAINFREGWRGYLWQGRFASFVLQGVKHKVRGPGTRTWPDRHLHDVLGLVCLARRTADFPWAKA